MKVAIEPVKISEKQILSNLLEKYFYEFSQYFAKAMNEEGIFGYPYLDSLWELSGQFPLFIKVDGKLAGFAIVSNIPDVTDFPTDFTMKEFFVIYPYRHLGIAQIAVNQLFEQFQGTWQLMYNPRNIISQKFWTKLIAEKDINFQLIKDLKEALYEPDIQGHLLMFNIK